MLYEDDSNIKFNCNKRSSISLFSKYNEYHTFFFDIVYIAMAEKGALKRGLRTWAGKEEQQKLLCKRSLKYQLDLLMTFCFGNAIKILLIGKTGVGKSHLTNALIGEQLAEEGKDFDPKTAEASFTEL